MPMTSTSTRREAGEKCSTLAGRACAVLYLDENVKRPPIARRSVSSASRRGSTRASRERSARLPDNPMRFRPCIDLHAGAVKQIVGSTLSDDPAQLRTNFESKMSAREFAEMYKRDSLVGGHVIMLGPGNEEAALGALAAYPSGLQVGGGVNCANARKYIDAGASHIIVTSWVFEGGKLSRDRLAQLVDAVGARPTPPARARESVARLHLQTCGAVPRRAGSRPDPLPCARPRRAGRERIVLDLSCRKRPDDPSGPYHVVMDKWQRFTDCAVDRATLGELAASCAEFLVHGVDVEGKGCGIEDELVRCLGECSPIPVTYAGGCRDLGDVERVRELGRGRVDVTIGSALDIFGGPLKYSEVVAWDAREAAAVAAQAPARAV